jgi:arginyl-tRNA--protein-N-Asp/Glu arginylyltransferase
VVRCQEELALQQALAAHFKRVGDAVSAAQCDEAVCTAARALDSAEADLHEGRTTGRAQRNVLRIAQDLADDERKYTLLRAYTQARHGAEWVAKSALSHHKLSDDALRAQARAWRPQAAA